MTVELANIGAALMGFSVKADLSVTNSSLSNPNEVCCATSTISGQKILDANCNGKFDAGDLPGVGWTFNLLSGSSVIQTGTTDANGEFTFYNVPNGTYTLQEVAQSGYTPRNPSSGQQTVVVSAVNSVQAFQFFNCKATTQTGTIKGLKFDDANCNGKDDGEKPLSGWIITATNTTTHVAVTATTDAAGLYSFNNLPAGTYTISETPQSGWTQTMPGGTGTYTVTLGPNQVLQKDFGNGHCNITPTPTPCAEVKGDTRCLPNGGYSYTFNVTNNSGSDMSQILLTPLPGSTFTLTPQLTHLSSPLQNGQSTTVTTNISNVKPGDKVCFFVSLMSEKTQCCIVQVCPTLPQCGGISPTPPPPPQRPPPPLRPGKRRP